MGEGLMRVVWSYAGRRVSGFDELLGRGTLRHHTIRRADYDLNFETYDD